MTDLHSIVSQEQVEIERLFVGSVVRSQDLALRDAGWLDPEVFMTPGYQEFWTRVKNGEDPIQVTFAMPELRDAFSWSNEILFNKVGSYAHALVEKNYLRASILAAEQIVKYAQDGDEGGIQQVVATMSTQNAGGASGMRTPLEIAFSLNERIAKGNISIPWGIDSLDLATRGKERGTMTVLAGRPSMGKSSLAFQCNEHQALEQKLKVGVWSLEMSGEQIFARRNCYKIDRMWMDVRSGMISASEEESLKVYNVKYAEELDGHLLVNDSTATATMDIVRTQLQEKFDVIMIDHLGLLEDRPLKGERHDQKLGRITKTLHALAKNTNSVILLLAQLNRGVEQRSDKRPTMADLRDSGEIEQNADNVGLIYGEWYYDKNADNTTEINFGKFRDGLQHSTAYVRFVKHRQEFESLTQREIDDLATEQLELLGNGDDPLNLQEEMPF